MSLYFDEQEAIEELQARGYRVVKESYPEVEGITTIKVLTEYFYARMKFYNPDRKYPTSIDYSQDSKYVSSFIHSREKLGLGRKMAIQEAAMLIDALFKYEEHLNLNEPIMQPTILAVRSIMDRVVGYINQDSAKVQEADTEKYIEEVNEFYNAEFAQRDFEKAAEQRRAISERIHERKRKCGEN